MLRVGIIGCGLIGRKRARSLGLNARLTGCSDIDSSKAHALASDFGGKVFQHWSELCKSSDIDIVIVSTCHDSLSEISVAALQGGKHVLVEKPAGRSLVELDRIISAEKKSERLVHVGFNHRYHRSIIRAKQLVDQGVIGDLMFIRGRYGHGGRVGYDKEWRADPVLSGGGELMDQGPHLIDLARWFLSDFSEVTGLAHTYYWDMPVDDNGFMLLKTKLNQTAFLHVSCTEWKNLFSMEIYGSLGKLELSGLGGSYGVERLTWYKMLPQMGPPETFGWEFPMEDNSWETEFSEFCEDIFLNRRPASNLVDARAALDVIRLIYEQSINDNNKKPT